MVGFVIRTSLIWSFPFVDNFILKTSGYKSKFNQEEISEIMTFSALELSQTITYIILNDFFIS